MNDETFRLVLSVLATLATTILGAIGGGVMFIAKKQTEQATNMELMRKDISILADTVGSLDSWKTQVENARTEYYKDEAERLREELHGRPFQQEITRPPIPVSP